jgi:hypothetical protein
VFYLKAACFGPDIDHHKAKNYTIIKRQVKNAIYKLCFKQNPSFKTFLFYNKIVKLYMVDGS